MPRRNLTTLTAMASLMLASPTIAQQLPDTAFAPAVPRPAFAADRGPPLCLDEAHHNFHTLGGRFLPFGKLAQRDGYRVSAARDPFTAKSLAACRILVIANRTERPIHAERAALALRHHRSPGGCA